MNLKTAIKETLSGFIAPKDDGYDHLSDNFGIHEGRTKAEWIEHEIWEFRRRKDLMTQYGVGQNPDIRIESIGRVGDVCFSVIGRDGVFIYQDTWTLGTDGKFVGNGRQFEIVTKLQFQEGEKPRRGLAVRSHKGKIKAVMPMSIEFEECDLQPGINGDRDGFASVSVLLPEDDLIGREAKFRIMDDAGNRATETVWLRGIEETQFEYGLFPKVDGPEVTVPMSDYPIWSLTIEDDAGDTAYFGHPEPGTYNFIRDVKTAFITDAMDNDWTVKA